jgi:hypothetical protein
MRYTVMNTWDRRGTRMKVSIARPDLMIITEEETGHTTFGGNQEWYKDEWHRRAGCGPTCAANVAAYLAQTRPGMRALYAGEGMLKSQFAAHMEEMYKFVTPGNMGLNRVEMFTKGMEDFAGSRGISLKAHVFEVHGNMSRNRPPVSDLIEFIRTGLAADCPIAFLNLTKGRVKNLQGWHWITITSAEFEDGGLMACASDEGSEIRFDLKLWYLSTRMRGGLVYFTAD